MTILPTPPPNRNGNSRWIEPAPRGIADWMLTLCVCVLAVPVLLTFGVFAWALRHVLKVGESC